MDLLPDLLPRSESGVERFLQFLLVDCERPFAGVEVRQPVPGGYQVFDSYRVCGHIPAQSSASPGLVKVPGLAGPASSAVYALLEGMVVGDVDENALLDACSAGQALIGAVTARMLEATAEFHARRTAGVFARFEAARAGDDVLAVRAAQRAADIADRGVADEIALVMSCSRSLAAGQVGRALTLTQKVPDTLAALAGGAIEPRKAAVISDLVGAVEDPVIRGQVEDSVLPRAPKWNVPTLREEIRKVILRLDPETAAERHERARADRRVVFSPADDDMIELWALLPADDGVRVRTALDIAADQATAPGDTRTADQRRTDALTDAVIGAIEHPHDCCAQPKAETEPESEAEFAAGPEREAETKSESGAAATGAVPTGAVPTYAEREAVRKRVRRQGKRALRHEVQVVVPFETITGDADEPGYLARYGPISAVLARRMAWDVAATGSWRCVITDDVHGTVLGLGKSTFTPDYEPPLQLRRHLNIRDRHCTYPGCRAPAAGCDKDHQTPHPGGHTGEDNLFNRCGHHHRLKHETTTTVRISRDPAHPPGTVIWTTPGGREYPNYPAAVGIPKTDAQPSRLDSDESSDPPF